jgi:predicted nuclease of predicted toxin-antitoxin system
VKFLCDQDVYAATVRFLRSLGHAVATAAELGLAQASDADLLKAAHAQSRISVTCDRDFGGLVFMQGTRAGVVYLRMAPSVITSVHAELERLLGL